MIRVNISNLCAIRADQSRGVLCHMQYIRSYYFNKLLTIQKGSSELIYQRRKDNEMIKMKTTKGITLIYKTIHRKLKIEQHYK
jgi:hypothetical protein